MSLHFVVGKDVDSLGVTFLSLPPAIPIINRVMPGSWAEVQKLQAEDEIVYMKGSRVADMTRHSFCKFIQERPLTLVVSRPSTKRPDQTPQVDKSATSDNTVDVSFEQTLPVPSLSMCPSAAAMVSDDYLQKFHQCCSSAKDISAAQNSDKVGRKSTNSPKFNLVAGNGVESLGVAFLTLPPGKVVIHQVVAGSWAEVQKLQVSDELVCMNGNQVAEMTRANFCKRIQERPLILDIYRPASECDSENEIVAGHDEEHTSVQSVEDEVGVSWEEWLLAKVFPADRLFKTAIEERLAKEGHEKHCSQMEGNWEESSTDDGHEEQSSETTSVIGNGGESSISVGHEEEHLSEITSERFVQDKAKDNGKAGLAELVYVCATQYRSPW